MNGSRNHFENEEPKYTKKSKKKGRPRADHKHEYKPVLLLNEYVSQYFPNEPMLTKRPMKVCMICGRVGKMDMKQYDLAELQRVPFLLHQRVIKDEDKLEKWCVDDYFDKFAKKIGDEYEASI